MDDNTQCFKCGNAITHGALQCDECSDFFEEPKLFCETCFPSFHGAKEHTAVPFDNTKLFQKKIITSIIDFEKKHMTTAGSTKLALFPINDENSSIWKRSDFSEISYRSPDGNTKLKDSVPFICDRLRMNNSLKSLINTLNLNICSTDIIISILKYSALDVRVFVFEQLTMFQRPIPIYFGVPSDDQLSMKYYFLLHEVLHALLPYSYLNIPFILSFGSSACRNKTLLLNKVLNTSFDCHAGTDFDCGKSSNYYHDQLIQLILGHPIVSVSQNDTSVRHTYHYHVLDLHGSHDWNQLPKFFIPFTSVIMIHIDAPDLNKVTSFPWPKINFNQTATYIIFIHGHTSNTQIGTDFQPKILQHFGPNQKNVHILASETILHSGNQILLSGLTELLRQAPVLDQSLFNISEQTIQEQSINLSTSVSALVHSTEWLEKFRSQLDKSSSTGPERELFPLSRLKEAAEKLHPSTEEKNIKEKLMKNRHDQMFKIAHPVITQLAEQSNDRNSINLFERLIQLWNIAFYQRATSEKREPSLSISQQLGISKECFLREFQERSREYKNLNGSECSYDDRNLMKDALIQIYRKSFERQQYIEIINATSATVYPELFEEAFSGNFDLKDFYVVGIIGEQSGGKSFAMNKIFGTKTAESKFKCTTGILATRVKITDHEKVKDIVILDTEGLLDLTKKDTEAQIFDRKMVLQVMARSNLILINIPRNVNKTMQKILEVVAYGLNKLEITNRPKLMFVFRDQDPKTMGVDGQKEHVKGVIEDINAAGKTYNFDFTKLISDYDIHEFSSPFADIVIEGRLISFFSHNFCQQALSLRRKIIDQLNMQTPHSSFTQWISQTLQLWQQINENSNLFDYESLLHLTLEKDLDSFCNHILTQANDEMRELTFKLLKGRSKDGCVNDNILERISQELGCKKKAIKENSLNRELKNIKETLLRKYNLHIFPEALFNSTTARITSSLDIYEADFNMVATREIRQDDFQRKLEAIPIDLAERIKKLSSVIKNSTHFEQLFGTTSASLKNDFKSMLHNDYKKQAEIAQQAIMANFLERNRIDDVGEKYFCKNINDIELKKFVSNGIQNEQPVDTPAANAELSDLVPTNPSSHGSNFFSMLIKRSRGILQGFKNTKQSDNKDARKLEELLTILYAGFQKLRSSQYYQSNLLPVPQVTDSCNKEIHNALKNNKIKNQDAKNLWITCYGIMINLFCQSHRDYIIKKLIGDFDQRIIRAKEEVKISIRSATTAEEHGEFVTRQIWTMIESEIQSHSENQHEVFFSTSNAYRPSIIAENCVNQLFRSNNYQLMWRYIQNPVQYVRNWLQEQFNTKYQEQLSRTIHNLKSHLTEKKKQYLRMIVVWKSSVEASKEKRTNSELIHCLVEFLINGKHEKNGIKLHEESGGFPTIQSERIRTVPNDANQFHLLKYIQLTAEKLESDPDSQVVKTTETIIMSEVKKDRLFEAFYNKAKGCGIPCPYCKQMCDNDNENHTEHRSSYHLLWVFTGYRDKYTRKPTLLCCTSNEAFQIVIHPFDAKDPILPFVEHMNRFNPTWKIINMKTPIEDYQLKAYIALEEDLANYYKFEGRADVEIRKKFLRTVVTAHCYGLLIGIDYENTPNDLGGVPTRDVACIRKQLLDSSIACSENLYELKNEDATKDKILEKLRKIVNNLDERSTFLFYFSGHGGKDVNGSCMLANDQQAISSSELVEILTTAKTNKIILIFDCCHAGGMSNSFSWGTEKCKEGIHILCSSRRTELSYQDETNGVFTRHLIKGLTGEYQCKVNSCSQCATSIANLRAAPIKKVTSTELTTYLTHAVSGEQNFTYTSINGSDFDISFVN